MNEVVNHWWERLEGSAGILRHYDSVKQIEPLLLAGANYDLRSLYIKLISLMPPVRLAAKWLNQHPSGVELTIRIGSNRVSFNQPVFYQETLIQTNACWMKGVAEQDGELKEVDFEGTTFELVQFDRVVVRVDASSVALSGIRPIDSGETDHFRNPVC